MAQYAFDAAGVGVVLDQLLSVVGPGGRVEVVAIHTKPYELNITGSLTMQDRVLGASIGYANDHAEAILSHSWYKKETVEIVHCRRASIKSS